MPKLSAGLLLYRIQDGSVEVLIAHPGGPFWAKKDEGAWSIPKGEYTEGEGPWDAARRGFQEELGKPGPLRSPHRFPASEAAQRKAHHGIRRLGRSRSRRHRQ